jgi:hypothetical protein
MYLRSGGPYAALAPIRPMLIVTRYRKRNGVLGRFRFRCCKKRPLSLGLFFVLFGYEVSVVFVNIGA